MKIDVNKAAELANEVSEYGNKKPLEMFDDCATLISSMPENPYKDAIIESFKKVESFYNDEYLPILKQNNDVLTETLPDFKKKIEELSNNISAVKSKTVESKIQDFDLGAMGL